MRRSMKLSERIRKEFIVGDNILNFNFLGKIEQLESDSQMLEDLIEMIFDCGIDGTDQATHVFTKPGPRYAVYNAGGDLSILLAQASTPREAIAAAIKEWKANAE